MTASIPKTMTAVVLTGHSCQAIDFFPRLAAAHDAALVPDVTAVDVEDGRCVFTRKVMNGKLDARTVPTGDGVVFASLQQGAFPPQPAAGAAAVEEFAADLSAVDRSQAELGTLEGHPLSEEQDQQERQRRQTRDDPDIVEDPGRG